MQRVNVAIASPGDVDRERDAILKVFTRWNDAHDHAFLHPVMWEYSSVPTLGDHPQHLLNEQIIERSDLLIAIFWSRLGTPTPTADSGTVEEIREVIKRKGPECVMLYFCKRSLPYDIDPNELARLRKFRAEMQSQGLYRQYETVDEFERDLYQHLDHKIALVAKSSIDQQVEAFQGDLKKIEAISVPGQSPDLDSLIDDSTHLKHNVWARLIMHRMVMRALLRRLCVDHGMGNQLSDTPSLRSMISRLANANAIDGELAQSLERLRESTHAAEWGSGIPPTDADIRYVLNDGLSVLKRVQKLLS